MVNGQRLKGQMHEHLCPSYEAEPAAHSYCIISAGLAYDEQKSEKVEVRTIVAYGCGGVKVKVASFVRAETAGTGLHLLGGTLAGKTCFEYVWVKIQLLERIVYTSRCCAVF